MGGRVVQMEVGLFNRFTVVALRIREPKQPFFQEIIFFVPEAEGNVLQAMGVGDTGYAVFTPSICPGSSMVVRKVYSNSVFCGSIGLL